MSADDRQTWEGLLRQGRQISGQLAQRYPVLQAAQRYASSNLEVIARGLKAVKGAGTEGDIERVQEGLPRLFATFGLKGYLLDITLPDSRAVALRVWDDLVTTVNTSTGSLLGNPHFQWPGLPTRARPEFQHPRSSSASPTSTAAVPAISAPAAGRPTPQGVPPFAAQLRQFSPEQLLRVSDEYLVDIASVDAVPDLAPAQRNALALRLARRTVAYPRR